MCHFTLEIVNITSFYYYYYYAYLFYSVLTLNLVVAISIFIPLQLDLLFNFLKCRDMIMRHSSFMQMRLFEKNLSE